VKGTLIQPMSRRVKQIVVTSLARTPEISVRMALGASPGDVLAMVLRQEYESAVRGIEWSPFQPAAARDA
jgi:hypothetical protein